MRYGLLALAVVLTACGDGNGSSPPIQSAVDATPPVITLIGDNPQVIAVGEAYVELGATATDNRDGDLTASIVIDASAFDSAVPGEYSVTYDVSDTSGNAAATVIRTIIYEDRTPPVIVLSGDNPLLVLLGSPYVEQGATAIDNVDGDLTAAIVIDTSGLDITAVGNHQVDYDVSDAAGNAAATVSRTVTVVLPVPAEPEVAVEGDIKTLIFSWTASAYADHYRLLENADGHSGFNQVGDDIPAGTLTASRDIAVHLFDWVEAQYIVEACNGAGCSSSDVVTVTDVMLDAIGYFKASNAGASGAWPSLSGDSFGYSLDLSADGQTLAVGALGEYSNATGIDGDQDDNSAPEAGAVYLFRFDGNGWHQQAYIKASNSDADDWFGQSVDLSADGTTLVVGAPWEDSNATGINGDQNDNSAPHAGAAYLFRFDGNDWYQQAYIKASNTDASDRFGGALALNEDGTILAVSAAGEESGTTGINGDTTDNSASSAGAVYLFRYDGKDWYQQAYIKASNTDAGDRFGQSVDLSADGTTLVVSAHWEDSNATGINGDQNDNSAPNAGAVYLFRFDGNDWYQQAYIKASNTDADDGFGDALAFNADGTTLAVSASGEYSNAIGIDGDQNDNSAPYAGAVYLFRLFGNDWYQQAYIKASNTDPSDWFGRSVALSADGARLAVGASGEDSNAAGVDGDQNDNSTPGSGAVYLFQFEDLGWSQMSYVKAPNPGTAVVGYEDGQLIYHGDRFSEVALSADGNTLAVGASNEASSATGIGGDQADNLEVDIGAVYLY